MAYQVNGTYKFREIVGEPSRGGPPLGNRSILRELTLTLKGEGPLNGRTVYVYPIKIETGDFVNLEGPDRTGRYMASVI